MNGVVLTGTPHQDAYLRVAFTTVSMTLTFQVNEGKTTTNQLGQRLDRMDIYCERTHHTLQSKTMLEEHGQPIYGLTLFMG